MSGKESVEFKVPKSLEDQLPTGWSLKTDVQKDGSKLPVYYCPDTRQHFYTYADLIRYVDYAKSAGVGVYSKGFKKREIDTEVKKTTTKARKTSASLSLPRKPSNPDSLTVVDRSSDSKSPTLRESSGKEKDEDFVAVSSEEEKDEDDVDVSSDEEKDGDYVPEPDGDATVYLEVDGESEVARYLMSSKKPRAHNLARC